MAALVKQRMENNYTVKNKQTNKKTNREVVKINEVKTVHNACQAIKSIKY